MALAAVALLAGGVVQGVVHEWRLRRLVAGSGSSAGDDAQAGRAANLRSLPIASAAASLASWTVGGASLALLSSALLDLDSSQSAELAVVCTTVGAMLAPFRYYRVRRELPVFWAILALPATSGAALGRRAVVSLPVKLALVVTLPLVGLLLTAAAATTHRRDQESSAAARARLDATARLVAGLLDPALRTAPIGADGMPGAAAKLISALDRASSRTEVALLDGGGGRIAGRSTFFDAARVVAVLEAGEPLPPIPGVLLGAARVDRVAGWLLVSESVRRDSAWSAIFAPRLVWLVALGVGGALVLTWLIAWDVRAGLHGVRTHLDALEPGVTSQTAARGERCGDDEIVELEAQVVELTARVRRTRLRRERRRAELDEAAARIEGRWREASLAVATEVDLAMRVRRAAEGLVTVVGRVEQLWGQLERELTRQDQSSVTATTAVEGALEACDRVTEDSGATSARVGRLAAAIRPLLDDSNGLRATADPLVESAGAGEDLSRTLVHQCRTVVDSCTRIAVLTHAVDTAASAATEGGDRVRVAVGDVGQSVHRIEEGVALLARGFRVLEEIADRSALLAVNAAIVAARSPSTGGGFAIVADEMRDLAQRAADGVHEAVQVANSLGRDVRGAVLAVEAVLVRLDQWAHGARATRSAIEHLATATSGTQDDAGRAEDLAGQANGEAARTRQLAEQVLSASHRMGITRASLEAEIESGGTLEIALRNVATELGSGVRAAMAQTRDSLRAMRGPAEVVERIDALARELGHGVQSLESDLRELAQESLRAQDLAKLLVEDVGSALRDRAELS